MTRPEKISKRKAFNKEVRAHAAHEQTPFATVLTRALDFQKTRSYRAMKNLPSHLPRNAKRVDTDGLKSVDGVGNVRDDDENDEDEDEKTEASKSFVVDLMGIAKPAKPKGKIKLRTPNKREDILAHIILFFCNRHRQRV